MSIGHHFECHCQSVENDHQSTESIPSPGETPLDFHASFVALLLSWFAVALLGACVGQSVDESQVKAAYLYNFAKFVEWPPATFSKPDDPFVICVLGEEHTSDVLEQSIRGKKANGRSFRTRRPHSSEELKTCHVLFIAFSDRGQMAKVLQELRGLSVLTVGQSEDFLPLGGMINMTRRDRTIELDINPEIPNIAGLKVSSRLLVVARVVKIERAKDVR